MENIIIIDYNMKAINIWMLGTVLFSGLISCEMKEEIFGKDIPTETGYLTLDVNAGSSSSVETKGATDQKEEFPLVIKALGFEYTKEYESFSKFKEETEGVLSCRLGITRSKPIRRGRFAEKMNESILWRRRKNRNNVWRRKTCNSEMFYSKCQDCYGFYP